MLTNALLMGAIAMASVVAAMFFLRFWRRTHDRFFLLFALAFLLDAINRVTLGLDQQPEEQAPLFYLVRLFSFGLILLAIVDKNLRGRRER
ncbi:DUF5985 family protein [Aquabacterium sp. A7-Y]|uniref:DUF5985 family protein n=1 Tax=Aquabacterium sp. A7-Y TaxID=1349605 RepID=UPI00223E3FD9|nr:DUF5985 family protein [Aquabacterium sp. A7-Y]MCW7542104.1 DUF5985 family protein [Aquabacterium sp. A7-Y]